MVRCSRNLFDVVDFVVIDKDVVIFVILVVVEFVGMYFQILCIYDWFGFVVFECIWGWGCCYLMCDVVVLWMVQYLFQEEGINFNGI